MSISIVIIAAGASRRMGTIKQLLPWKNTTLLGNAIQQAQKSKASEVVVVLGANRDQIKAKINSFNAKILHNKQWELGMGTSISCAIHYLNSENKECLGVLFILADQPLITTEHYTALISAFNKSKGKIIATAWDNKLGVPALFDSSFFKDLSKLDKDFGAKQIISENAHLVHAIKSIEKLTDIDTMDVYRLMFEKYGA